MALSMCAVAVLLASCSEDAPETFYEPPRKAAPESVDADWFERACLHYQDLRSIAADEGAEALATSLQQLFLGFGFDEIRVDPFLAPEQAQGASLAQHVTASIRGLTRDTVLVLSPAPPHDRGNLVPLLSVARAWAQNTTVDQPPLMTLRFAVLGSHGASQPPNPTNATAISDFLSHRARSVAQTAAVVALDPDGPATFQTTAETLQPILLAMTSPTEPVSGPKALTDTVQAIEKADLPTISANLAAGLEPTSCEPKDIEAIQSASQRLLSLIETSLRALGRPPTGDITLSDG